MDRFMRESDALSWHLEQDPVLRSTVVVVAWLERSPDWDRLVQAIERVTCASPPFRQRVVEPLLRWGTPRWTVDPEFDLRWHIRRMDAPAPRAPATVLELARREAMSAFDRSRPLWQLTLVEHLEAERAALVLKLHHSLTDGLGGMMLAALLFDRQRNATPVADGAGPPEGEQVGPWGATAELLRWEASRTARLAAHHLRSAAPTAARAAVRPARTAAAATETLRSIGRTVAPVMATMSPVMVGRGRGRSLAEIEVPLDQLKAAARAGGGSLNDGFLAAVTGGLRRYHDLHGRPVRQLRVMMPISIRRPEDPAGGNRITLMRFPLPVDEGDPSQRVTEIERRCRAARDERSLGYTNAIAGALDLLPTGLVGALFKRVDFVASDVPGFDRPVYLAGAEVERLVTFGPTTGTALNLTLLSYRGRCSVGVTVDEAAVADPEILLACLRQGFDEVLALAPRLPRRRHGSAVPTASTAGA